MVVARCKKAEPQALATLTRKLFVSLVSASVVAYTTLLAQSSSPARSTPTLHEFPVTMNQKIVAGQTPVGTKVEAKLTIATLLDGHVIPIGAMFAGEVVESAAKSTTDPSRLAIRMDSVQWKKGSAPVKVYLTKWYYPIRMPGSLGNDDLSNNSLSGSIGMTRGGISRPNSPSSSPVPGQTSPADPGDVPPGTSSNVSENRVEMKDVAATAQPDGSVVLTSKRTNIKLDRTTTYVLATGEETPGK